MFWHVFFVVPEGFGDGHWKQMSGAIPRLLPLDRDQGPWLSHHHQPDLRSGTEAGRMSPGIEVGNLEPAGDRMMNI